MSAPVPIAMFMCPALTLALFAVLPPRRAVLASLIGAWLLLPVVAYELPGLPDYTKITATSYAISLGILLFDFHRVSRLALSWLDLPVIIVCLSPMPSSLSNGLGVYDGASAVLAQFVMYGVPYFVGRMYFFDREGLRDLALAIFVGGLIYAPLCLYEIRMSPQLHKLVYGLHQHDFGQTKRFGGWRPMVFMQHGLAVGFWMASASLTGVWLWNSGVLRHVRGVSMSFLVPVLLVTTVLCKSAGSLVLLAVGAGVLFATQRTRRPIWMMLLIAAPIAYMGLRATGDWSGRPLIAFAEAISDERAGSLQVRLDNEDLLAEKAWERPVFGWGGWGRNRVYDDDGRDMTTTDGLWIITLGQKGLLGLGSLYTMLLLPVALLVSRVRAAHIASVENAPVIVTGVLIVLFACDSLFNAMPNPLFVMAAGGLGAHISKPRPVRHHNGTSVPPLQTDSI